MKELFHTIFRQYNTVLQRAASTMLCMVCNGTQKMTLKKTRNLMGTAGNNWTTSLNRLEQSDINRDNLKDTLDQVVSLMLLKQYQLQTTTVEPFYKSLPYQFGCILHTDGIPVSLGPLPGEG
jgi:hypothetical protein